MAYTFDLNVAQSYQTGRHVLTTLDGLVFSLVYEKGASGGHYGSIYSQTFQGHLFANTEKIVQMDQFWNGDGVYVSDNKIFYEQDGVYAVSFCLHFYNNTIAAQTVGVWVTKNGTVQPLTTDNITLQAGERYTYHKTFIQSMLGVPAGQGEEDYHQILWSASDIGVYLQPNVAAAPIPASPAVLVSVMQIADVGGGGGSVIPQELLADKTVQGIIVSKTAGENLVFGDLVYFKSDGKVWKANASVAGTYPALAMAGEDVLADANGSFLLSGVARNDAWTWVVGGKLYLSTTAGTMSQTAPTTTDHAVQVLGVAHANGVSIYFNPSIDYITLL